MTDGTAPSNPTPPPPRRWEPPSMRTAKEQRQLSYMVVDEIESGLVGLSVSPWPTMDDVGRLRFGAGRSRSVGAWRAELERFLRKHRTPRAGSSRPVRIGDVFAVAAKEPIPEGQLAEPSDWIEPPLYDISADARDAAKASFYSAVAPTLDPKAKADAQILAMATSKKPTQGHRKAKG